MRCHESLVESIGAACAQFADRPAILCEGFSLTFSELWILSSQLAGTFADRGVKHGDRVGLYAANGPEFVLLYLAILRVGATVVPINLLINVPEILHIMQDAGLTGIIAQKSLAEKINAVLASLEKDSPWVVFFGDSDNPRSGLGHLLGSTLNYPAPKIDPKEDPAAILYTSGTTGFPKGAVLTHGNLLSNAASVGSALCFESGQERILVVLPMFHAFAATVGILAPLSQGCAILPVPRFEPQRVCDAIAAHQATIFLGVPSMFSLLLRLPLEMKSLLSSLKFAVSGGAALSPDVLRDFELRYGVPVLEGDGPTECSPVTCVNPVRGIRKPGTVGLPVPSVEMCILDDEGRPCPDGVVGEIAVRGPNVMKGYWGREAETREVMRGDWFLTGDLGTRDGDGYFSILDRKKDLILVNGMNVYPRMVEEVLLQFAGVVEVAVVGEPDSRHGEVPYAYLVLESSCYEISAIRRHCQRLLGRHQIPRQFVVLDALPRNAAGKVIKRMLKRQGEVERGIDLVMSDHP